MIQYVLYMYSVCIKCHTHNWQSLILVQVVSVLVFMSHLSRERKVFMYPYCSLNIEKIYIKSSGGWFSFGDHTKLRILKNAHQFGPRIKKKKVSLNLNKQKQQKKRSKKNTEVAKG